MTTQSNELHIAPSIRSSLPEMVKNSLASLSPQMQQEFIEEYSRKSKSVGLAYVLWLFLGLHYAYLRKWGLQVLFWLTTGGLDLWWFIDLSRVGGLIKDYNKDVATDTLRSLKALRE